MGVVVQFAPYVASNVCFGYLLFLARVPFIENEGVICAVLIVEMKRRG